MNNNIPADVLEIAKKEYPLELWSGEEQIIRVLAFRNGYQLRDDEVKELKEQVKILHEVETYPFVKKKAEWFYIYKDLNGNNQHSKLFPSYDEMFQDYSELVSSKPGEHNGQLTSANKRIEELEEPLRSIAEEKYPENVFTPISDEDFKSIKNYCEQILYIPLDRLSAHYGRIFQKIFSDMAKEALNK